MSIASEISRLQGAKADIKEAIEGKGVTVPSATKIDGYADLVDAIPQGSTPTGTKQISISSNGVTTENVGGYASAEITTNVPNSYSASDEGKVVDNGALVSQTSKNINSNGTVDTTKNNEVVVAVPNTYTQSDEGKVVSNGALVAQTSDTVTTNDTYDTTLINSLTVNVSGGSFPNLMNFEEVLVTSTATNIDVQLTPSDHCSICLLIKDVGQPDASLYKALLYSQVYAGAQNGTAGNAILRPNGTIGSDGQMASFNKTTGVFSFGNGPYGKAIAGDTYYVYQFSVGA